MKENSDIKPPTYKSLMAFKGIDKLSNEGALGKIAHLIDACDSLRRSAGITKALEWCDALQSRGLTDAEQTTLDYFRANAWDKRRPRTRKKRLDLWRWDQPALREEILCLRQARINSGFKHLHKILRCQIVTNLGNQLSTAGRVVEALEPWTEAIAIEPYFWMARGNRGCGLLRYARLLYSEYHSAALLFYAHRDLLRALEDANTHGQFGYPEARTHFEREKAWIDAHFDVVAFSHHFVPDKEPPGNSQPEQRYRRWCLTNNLFLNPINDALACSACADDDLVLPEFVTELNAPPMLIGFFNQLKQEHVSARWFYYCGTHTDRPHFSDREVTLYNTLDYPAYGLAVEQLRTSYRVAYSLFDKIAFFINAYFNLGIPPSEVSFGSVWRNKNGHKNAIAPRFERSKNLPLRGLYWLSLDLRDPSFKTVMNPDAQELSDIRNQLEHRYLKVHEIFAGKPGMQQPIAGDPFVDTMAYSIGRGDFEEKTLRLLKLSRAALIHLALSMHQEERRRGRARRSTRPIAGQALPIIKDSWKR